MNKYPLYSFLPFFSFFLFFSLSSAHRALFLFQPQIIHFLNKSDNEGCLVITLIIIFLFTKYCFISLKLQYKKPLLNCQPTKLKQSMGSFFNYYNCTSFWIECCEVLLVSTIFLLLSRTSGNIADAERDLEFSYKM